MSATDLPIFTKAFYWHGVNCMAVPAGFLFTKRTPSS